MVSLNDLKNRKQNVTNFRHCFLEEKNVYSEDTDKGRFYVTPEGNRYRSVTGFLSTLKGDPEWLDRWKAKLGGEEAAEIEMTRRKDRGTGVHLALEYLLRNDPQPHHAGEYVKMYHQLETMLKMYCDDIYCLETPLYSDILQLGGRVDCIAKWKGELSIIDFKTSSNFKKADWITDYFLQGTCYSLMLEELYGLKASQIVIMVCIEGEIKPQIFTRDRREFTALLREKIKEFRHIQSKEENSVESFFS